MGVQRIDLTPIQQNGQIVSWQLCHRNKCGTTKADYPLIELKEDSGAHVFIAQIKDTPGFDVKFSSDPLWIQSGQNNKPTGPTIEPKDQIKEVVAAGKTLIFVDENSNNGEMYLSYQLNFESADGKSVVPSLDPEIRNGGGGGGLAQGIAAYADALLIAGAVALTLVAYVIGRRAGRRSVARQPAGSPSER